MMEQSNIEAVITFEVGAYCIVRVDFVAYQSDFLIAKKDIVDRHPDLAFLGKICESLRIIDHQKA